MNFVLLSLRENQLGDELIKVIFRGMQYRIEKSIGEVVVGYI